MADQQRLTFEAWSAGARHVSSGGLRVATYDVHGSPGAGDPVVTYLHGYPSSSLDVEPVAALLAPDVPVLALDFPGFGASDKPVGHPWSVAACADAVEAAWADRGVTEAVLVAHDYGVSPAQELLARSAEGRSTVVLRGVVWHNGGIYADLHRPTVGQQLLLDPDHGAEVAAAITPELFRSGVEVTWGERVPLEEFTVAQMWDSMAAGGGVARAHELLHYVAERRRFADRWAGAMETTELPSWFVWGDLDPVSGAHMVERVETRVPGARIVRLADVGHWPTLEAPSECAAALVEALEA